MLGVANLNTSIMHYSLYLLEGCFSTRDQSADFQTCSAWSFTRSNDTPAHLQLCPAFFLSITLIVMKPEVAGRPYPGSSMLTPQISRGRLV